jgi:glycerol-3-phosphate acyltransferase PlsY
MIYVWISLAMIASYLVGSIPFGFVIPKIFKGIDIRQYGSKNVGSTNVKRTLGLKYALPVFLLDCFKGALPIIIIRYIIGDPSMYMIDVFDITILYGMAAILGHIYPIFLRFKGGKAVATGVGAVIALVPYVGLAGILIFFIVAYSTRYVSVGSVVATFLVGVGMYLDVWLDSTKNFLQQSVNLTIITLMVALIIFKHRKNFVRLLNGTENKIGQKVDINKDKTKSNN